MQGFEPAAPGFCTGSRPKIGNSELAPLARIRFETFFEGVAGIDVGFPYAGQKSLPQSRDGKSGRQTHMDG